MKEDTGLTQAIRKPHAQEFKGDALGLANESVSLRLPKSLDYRVASCMAGARKPEDKQVNLTWSALKPRKSPG